MTKWTDWADEHMDSVITLAIWAFILAICLFILGYFGVYHLGVRGGWARMCGLAAR